MNPRFNEKLKGHTWLSNVHCCEASFNALRCKARKGEQECTRGPNQVILQVEFSCEWCSFLEQYDDG